MLCVSILGGRTEGKRRNLIEHSGNLLRLGLFVLGFIKMSFIFQVGHSRLREQRHENCIVYLRMIRHLTSLERILTEGRKCGGQRRVFAVDLLLVLDGRHCSMSVC